MIMKEQIEALVKELSEDHLMSAYKVGETKVEEAFLEGKSHVLGYVVEELQAILKECAE